MLRLVFICIVAVTHFVGAGPARADCAVIDQIDKLYTIQNRMIRDLDNGLFASDIRQMRTIMSTLSNRAALDAISGNAITGRGREMVRFLEQTQELLSRASLDDPRTVWPHFDGTARRTISGVGTQLTELRCTREQINIARAAARSAALNGDSDSEDLAEVLQALTRLGEQVTRPRNIFLFVVTVGAILAAAPIIRRLIILHKRRTKRHPANYTTSYRHASGTVAGSLLDINCFGTKLARAETGPLDVGQTVEIAIDDGWIVGTVVWSNRHYSGVRFEQAISLDHVTDVLANSDRS